MSELLASDGWLVAQAPGGAEALRLLTELDGRVDLVLTDVRMPGMDGLALCESLRARWPWMKVVFMTGYGGEALSAVRASDPATPILQKPFEYEALLAASRRRSERPPMGTHLDPPSPFLRALLDTADDPFWGVDREHRLIFANRFFLDRFEKVFGVSLAPGDLPNPLLATGRPRGGAPVGGDLRRSPRRSQRHAGSSSSASRRTSHTFLVSIYPVEERGEIVGVLCTGKDVTALKDAQRALSESAAGFRRVFEASPAPIVISSPKDGRILDANAAFAKMCGYPREAMVGRPPSSSASGATSRSARG